MFLDLMLDIISLQLTHLLLMMTIMGISPFLLFSSVLFVCISLYNANIILSFLLEEESDDDGILCKCSFFLI